MRRRITCAVALSGLLLGFATPATASTPSSVFVGATTTSLAVTPSTGPANQSVTVVVTVAAGAGGPHGAVTVSDGATILARAVPVVGGRATITTNGLGSGPHALTAAFTATSGPGTRGPGTSGPGTSGPGSSVSSPVPVSYGEGATAGHNVVVVIPSGALTVTSTLGAGPVVDLVVTDTRAGNLGLTVTAVARRAGVRPTAVAATDGSAVGLAHVSARQVPGNALPADEVRVVDLARIAPGGGTPQAFAHYPAGLSTGSVRLHADVTRSASPVRGKGGQVALSFTAF